jgi:phosphoenolpyruvate-protein phosphotransferase (PTS system enzyme I)
MLDYPIKGTYFMEKNIVENTPYEFRGLAVTAGKVTGPACLYSAERHRSVQEMRLSDEEALEELARFENALFSCSEELETIALSVASKVGKAEAEIFLTQKHVMNDAAIVQQIRDGIRDENKNADFMISDVFMRYEQKFISMDNEYLRERATDIGEIRRRLLDKLNNTRPGLVCEGQRHCSRGANRVIVAEELTVEMMAHMNFEKIRGLVTEHGGTSSHAAIIARSLGIPAVSGVRDIMKFVKCGDVIVLDGDNGRVYLNPPQDLINRTIPPQTIDTERSEAALMTPPGMQVCANASSIEDIQRASAMHADGIGLFRTEILFLKADRLLDEEEQYSGYLQAVETIPEKIVTFRLLDVGGDKPLPFLRLKKENNPYLGWRGARFLLGNPDIFAMQIRALVKVSRKKPLRILFPMIVDAVQQETMINAVKEIIVTSAGVSENIEMGAMFEVPSACMQAREIFRLVDFGSIGSNDLIQYLFAVDRTNEQVSSDYNPGHPVLWKMLEDLSIAAREIRKSLSICGEMAGREGVVGRLLDIGIKSISVSPRLIPQVRREMTEYVNNRKSESAAA